MTQDFCTVAEVAESLKLHVKTVLNFVHDGRLKATRIGKQYRIARSDLEAFTGSRPSEQVRRHRHVEVSSVVHIDAIGVEQSNRAITHLMSALKGRSAADAPARLDTIYYEEQARLKIIVSGSIETTAAILGFIPALIDA
jgi:excisionase family DNA binding protein